MSPFSYTLKSRDLIFSQVLLCQISFRIWGLVGIPLVCVTVVHSGAGTHAICLCSSRSGGLVHMPLVCVAVVHGGWYPGTSRCGRHSHAHSQWWQYRSALQSQWILCIPIPPVVTPGRVFHHQPHLPWYAQTRSWQLHARPNP